MRIRSWMTAWALFAGLGHATFAPAPALAAEADGEAVAIVNTVRLEIQISGLGAEGARVEIKPSHPGCKFEVVKKTIPRGTRSEVVKLDTISISASTSSADRDCSFEITILEPGRSAKTFRRGLQLSPPSAGVAAAPSRTLKCYLPATAIASKDDPKTKTPRR